MHQGTGASVFPEGLLCFRVAFNHNVDRNPMLGSSLGETRGKVFRGTRATCHEQSACLHANWCAFHGPLITLSSAPKSAWETHWMVYCIITRILFPVTRPPPLVTGFGSRKMKCKQCCWSGHVVSSADSDSLWEGGVGRRADPDFPPRRVWPEKSGREDNAHKKTNGPSTSM